MSMDQYKDLLDISNETYEQDKQKLEKIWEITEKQFLFKLRADKVPSGLEYVVPSVVVKRYNRIGHEGMKQHTQSEETIQYSLDDFAEFQQDINDYLEENSLVKKRSVSFL